MAISLKPAHIKRYKDIALLFLKYGRGDIVRESGLDVVLSNEERNGHYPVTPKAEQLATDLENMGPIFIKLGQLLSSRCDFLPPQYIKTLSRLQDNIAPFSFSEIEKIITTELNVRMSKAFSEFDPAPIATASLGQVHRAALRDGKQVAVKVQRPGIREQIVEDMDALTDVVKFLDKHTDLGRQYRFEDLLEEFHKNITHELDYHEEARNLIQVGENLKHFDLLIVPQPILTYTTSRVLVMEYVHGKKITELGPLAHLEIDGNTLAEDLFRAYLQQILVDGLFHADPHPGNVFITHNHKIALIDLGMVGRISTEMQEHLLALLMAVSEGQSDEVATLLLTIAKKDDDFDESNFRRIVTEMVAEQQGATMADIQTGTLIMKLTSVACKCGIRTPPELAMLGKTLLNLDEVGRILNPNFDPNEAIRRNATEIGQRRILKSISHINIVSPVIEMKQLLEKLPQRINKILDTVSNNNLKLSVDVIDKENLVSGFQKIANRISVSTIIAALIIGAALLMRIETRFIILGYPGFAMICFIAAAGIGFWLVLNILRKDTEKKKRR